MKRRIRLTFAFLMLCGLTFAQEVSLFQQFNGRFDYTAIGNTLNTVENGSTGPCEILTESAAILALEPDQEVVAAFLYWAGSGTGDFKIKLNDLDVIPQRTFNINLDEERSFFAAVTEVTSFVRDNGNIDYTVSELDLSGIIDAYCPTGTNFAGWSIIIIYRDNDLPLNQVNLYEGLERVPTSIAIELESLNVLDDVGAKIGFLAWEGDQNISVEETLSINGDIISNPPLNPADNAFNGTNSFTEATDLFNMDIDFYNIEDNIEPGDTSALIELTSGQDFVMINNIVTVLNSQLPDATSSIDSVSSPVCGDRTIVVDFTIYNINSTDVLPQGTPVSFFGDSTLITTTATLNDIPIDGSESQTITLNIPASVANEFTLRVSADNTGANVGIVPETNESNNDDTTQVRLLKVPEIPVLENLEVCDAVGIESFDLTQVTAALDADLTVSFHLTEADALANTNAIDTPENYINTTNPETIFVRVANADCSAISTFTIAVIICPLPDATVVLPITVEACRNRDFVLEFTVQNLLGTNFLPSGTPIAFYANDTLIAVYFTPNDIPSGGLEIATIFLNFPADLPDNFSLLAIADDDGNSIGVIEELDETNNLFKSNVNFNSISPIGDLPELVLCDEGFDIATFDLTVQNSLISENSEDLIRFYNSVEDAENQTNAIIAPQLYNNTSNPEQIYVRLDTPVCFTVASFFITTENCPPTIPEGFSPNGDGINDLFEIQGLLDIFPEHNIQIYSRLGTLIFQGNNSTGHWNGIPNTGIPKNEAEVPSGVYYYVLNLNDSNYSQFLGWLYLNK